LSYPGWLAEFFLVVYLCLTNHLQVTVLFSKFKIAGKTDVLCEIGKEAVDAHCMFAFVLHLLRCDVLRAIGSASAVPRLDGARGKKQG